MGCLFLYCIGGYVDYSSPTTNDLINIQGGRLLWCTLEGKRGDRNGIGDEGGERIVWETLKEVEVKQEGQG